MGKDVVLYARRRSHVWRRPLPVILKFKAVIKSIEKWILHLMKSDFLSSLVDSEEIRDKVTSGTPPSSSPATGTFSPGATTVRIRSPVNDNDASGL